MASSTKSQSKWQSFKTWYQKHKKSFWAVTIISLILLSLSVVGGVFGAMGAIAIGGGTKASGILTLFSGAFATSKIANLAALVTSAVVGVFTMVFAGMLGKRAYSRNKMTNDVDDEAKNLLETGDEESERDLDSYGYDVVPDHETEQSNNSSDVSEGYDAVPQSPVQNKATKEDALENIHIGLNFSNFFNSNQNNEDPDPDPDPDSENDERLALSPS